MAGTLRNSNSRGTSRIQGISRRGGNRGGRRGGSDKQYSRDMPKHRFPEGPGREDHYGIKMQGETAECDICCQKSDLFALGPCFHPICMECGIRIRILGKNETCPKCRTEIEQLYFVRYMKDWTSDVLNRKKIFPHKDAERYKIVFEDEYTAKCFDSYLAHVCPICKKKGDSRQFATFASLDQHVYMVHRFQYCNICVEHLALLSHERRVYSQYDMEKHMKDGDSDDRSQKGHPRCLFCEQRFLDEEYRYKHLRKDHFFCPICDADGYSNYFFPEHADLIKHYKAKHVICEEGGCKQLGIVFRNEMELKLHKSSQHGAGPQRLNLDYHYERGGATGNSRGSRRLVPTRRLPRIGVIPNENPVPARSSDSSDFRIVPSVQSQGGDVSLRYSRAPAFTIQCNDFPRLSSGVKQTSRKLNQENGEEHKPAVAERKRKQEKIKAESSDATATTSWFIDDDENFGSCRRTLEQKNLPDEVSAVGPSVSAVAEEPQPPKTPYSAAFLRPSSLSNIAAKLRSDQAPDLKANDVFPSLSSSDTAIKNLPSNSAWKNNKLHFPDKQQIVSCMVPRKRGDVHLDAKMESQGSQVRKLPEPDQWPQQSVPSCWEERLGSENEIKSKKTSESTSLIVRTEGANKKKRGKKEKAKIQRRKGEEEGLEELRKDGNLSVEEDSVSLRNVDGKDHLNKSREGFSENNSQNEASFAPSSKPNPVFLNLETEQSESRESSSSCLGKKGTPDDTGNVQTKSASSFSDMLSSTFASLLNGFSKLTSSSAESSDRLGTSSLSAESGRVEELDERSEETPINALPPPPGIISMSPFSLPPPPGFGPPPGFESSSLNAT